MPNLESMVKGKYGVRDWLNYYRNVWTRNLTARLTDVQTDTELKKKTPDETVQGDDGQPLPVKHRLEIRKIAVQDAVNLIGNIDKLLALDDAQLAATYGLEALKVAADMIPKADTAEKTPEQKELEQKTPPSPEAKV